MEMLSLKRNVILEDHSDTMLRLPEQVRNRRKPREMRFYIYVGLILLIALAMIAYGLMEGIFVLFGEHFTIVSNTTSISESISTSTEEKAATTVVPIPDKPCERRIVGYYDLNYYDRLTDLQLSLLTHIIVFPTYVDVSGTLSFKDDDHKEKFKKLVKRAKIFKVKTIITAATNTRNTIHSDIFASSDKRRTLIDFIIATIIEYELDGVEVFWKWPETESDYQHLIIFLSELREAFKKQSRPLIISQLAPSQPKNSKLQHEVSKLVDFLNVVADNHYGWRIPHRTHLVGPGAPLYSDPKSDRKESVDNTMRRISCWTGTPNKLNMLLAADGRYWNNVANNTNSSETLWMTAEPVNGGVQGGTHWWRDLKRNGWDVSKAMWNDETKTSYIWNPEKQSYLAFENERSLREKIKYAIDKNIGGITYWEMNSDDDSSSLLKVISSANLCSGKNNTEMKYNCDDVHIY